MYIKNADVWWWSRCMSVFRCFQNVAVVTVLWVCKSPGPTFLHVEFRICTFSTCHLSIAVFAIRKVHVIIAEIVYSCLHLLLLCVSSTDNLILVVLHALGILFACLHSKSCVFEFGNVVVLKNVLFPNAKIQYFENCLI